MRRCYSPFIMTREGPRKTSRNNRRCRVITGNGTLRGGGGFQSSVIKRVYMSLATAADATLNGYFLLNVLLGKPFLRVSNPDVGRLLGT